MNFFFKTQVLNLSAGTQHWISWISSHSTCALVLKVGGWACTMHFLSGLAPKDPVWASFWSPQTWCKECSTQNLTILVFCNGFFWRLCQQEKFLQISLAFLEGWNGTQRALKMVPKGTWDGTQKGHLLEDRTVLEILICFLLTGSSPIHHCIWGFVGAKTCSV